MIKDVLLDKGANEIRLAILEDGVVSEIQIEKNQEKSLVGNIYKGKVVRVLPGMQSAFVDIGLNKNAYLYVKDVLPENHDDNDKESSHSGNLPDISEFLKQGQEIIVQVIKDAIGEKGPRITTHISVPGRYTVLFPHGNTIGISKRIDTQEERQRLRQIVASVKPEDCGIIVRTASENIHEDLLIEEINAISSIWKSIREQEKKGNAPRLLYGQSIIEQAIREHLASSNRFLVNDREIYDKILSLLRDEAPDLKERVEYYNKDYDMFEYYNVQSALKEALSRKVWLKNGAYLVFDYTEAMTVVDVNSGKFVGKTDMEETVFKINLEAAKALVRQIRLRNLSGIIIVDFIDMQNKEHRQKLLQHLREAVKADKIQTVVVGMTSLGLVEITRKKVHLPLSNHYSH